MFSRTLAHVDTVADSKRVRRNADLFPTDLHMTVRDHLASAAPRRGEAEPPDDVIKAELEKLVETVGRLRAMYGERLVHVIAELPLRQAVSYAHLLLLEHVLAVLALPTATATLILRATVGRKREFLRLRFFKDGCAEALCYFISWAGFHISVKVLHATRLRRAWTVVRYRRHILDRTDLDTLARESTQY